MQKLGFRNHEAALSLSSMTMRTFIYNIHRVREDDKQHLVIDGDVQPIRGALANVQPL